MRSTHLVRMSVLLACACALTAGCRIHREPPRVVQTSERVEAATDAEDADGDEANAERFAGYTEAALRDGGLWLGAQAGSAASPPDEDTDADAGIDIDCDRDAP